MKTNNPINQELKELGITLPASETMPYEVPINFFASFSQSILSEVKQEEFINQLPKENTFEVPSGYFDALHANLMNEIRSEKFLETLPKETPYSVGNDYFTSLSDEIITKSKVETKSLTPLRYTTKRFASFAIAASIALFISIGFGIFNVNSTPSLEQQLASIPDSEIDTYIKKHAGEFELTNSLEHVDATKIDINKLENEILQKQLNSLSEKDLEKFIL